MKKHYFRRGLLLSLCAAILLLIAACGAPQEEVKTYKLACLGDSITFGVGSSDPDCKYTSVIRDEADFIESVQSVATGSAMVGLSPTATAWHTYSLVNRYSAIDEDTDFIFIFGGTNDFGYTSGDTSGVPLGEPGDTTADTFYGALEILINNLRTDYPNAILLFATPLQRDDTANDFSPADSPYNVFGYTLEDYREAIIYVCEKEDVEYIDLYNLEGMRLSDPEFSERYADGLHPNDAGYKIVAEAIIAKLKTMLPQD